MFPLYARTLPSICCTNPFTTAVTDHPHTHTHTHKPSFQGQTIHPWHTKLHSPFLQMHIESHQARQSHNWETRCVHSDWFSACNSLDSKPIGDSNKWQMHLIITVYSKRICKQAKNQTLTSLSQPQDTITGFCVLGEKRTQETQSVWQSSYGSDTNPNTSTHEALMHPPHIAPAPHTTTTLHHTHTPEWYICTRRVCSTVSPSCRVSPTQSGGCLPRRPHSIRPWCVLRTFWLCDH